MARTVGALITEARGYIQDTDTETFRYSDADLVNYLNNSITEARRIRPDFFVNTYDSDLPQFTVNDLATDFPLDPQLFTACAYFVAGSAGLRDDENVISNRAIGLLGFFTAKLTSAGS